MEKRVIIPNHHGQNLIGILHQNHSKTLLIVCHGLIGSKNRPLIKTLSSLLYQKGLAVFRFDFTGCGESGGEKNVLLSQQVNDIKQVVEYFCRHHHYQKFVLIGHSLGGLVCALATIIFPKKISGLITLAGAFYPQMINPIYLLYKYLFRLKKSYHLNHQYYHQHFLPKKINLPTLVIHGRNDHRVPPRQSEIFYRHLKTNKKLLIVPKTGHNFTRKGSLTMITEEIINWLGQI